MENFAVDGCRGGGVTLFADVKLLIIHWKCELYVSERHVGFPEILGCRSAFLCTGLSLLRGEIMGRRRSFTLKEATYLRSLPAVKEISASRITYDDRFKVECVRRYLEGESARMIFRDAGLDVSLVGPKRIERCVARWKKDPSVLKALNQTDVLHDSSAFEGKEEDFKRYFDNDSQLHSQDIADAAFAAISGNAHTQSTIDMQELIIYQQSQHITMLQRQITQLQRKLKSAERAENVKENAAKSGKVPALAR